VSDVHRVAAEGFDRAAAVYERARPGYPPEVVAFLIEQLSVPPGGTVVDLAAGTGKLTRELVARELNVVAVEPVAGMRETFSKAVPGVPIVDGTAEAMPFGDHGVDAITAAQAAHWFDAARAVVEMHRVLRTGGRIGLIWNVRDESHDWVREVTKIIDPYERANKVPRYRHGAWRPAFDDSDLIRPVAQTTFSHAQVVTLDDFLERFTSCSFIAVLDEETREEVLGELRALVETHPDLKGKDTFEHPYVAEVYVYETV
jgi:ubiquinone/menaquinone biosynthesis C-methylase UbiE